MPNVLIVADDLTGANATGVMVAKLGLRSTVLLSPEGENPAGCGRGACVAVSTGSRGLPPEDAYGLARRAVEYFAGTGVRLYSKRIDSTLRGNLGAETDGVLDALGGECIAVVAPCFPDAGRIQAGGYLLVGGVPVERTPAAADPKNPVRTSQAERLYREQSRYPAGSIGLDTVSRGPRAVAEQVNRLAREGARSLIADGVTNEDLACLAKGVLLSGRRFAAVDPGPFTAALAAELFPRRSRGKTLLAIGTTNAVTRRQVEGLLASPAAYCAFLDVAQALESEAACGAQIRRLTGDLLEGAREHDVLALLVKSIDPRERVDFAPYMERDGCTAEALSGRVNQALAEVVRQTAEAEERISALLASGGDTASTVFRALGARTIELTREVLPLMACGRIQAGGRTLLAVTKGGMAGDARAVEECLAFLQDEMEKEREEE